MTHDDRLLLLRQFEVVAYGCNQSAKGSIEGFLRNHSLTYQFVEYFLDRPVPKDGEPENRFIFFPFLRNYLYDHPFFLDPSGVKVPGQSKDIVRPLGTLRPRITRVLTELSKLGYWMPFDHDRSFFGWKVFQGWLDAAGEGTRRREELNPSKWTEHLRKICESFQGSTIPSDGADDRTDDDQKIGLRHLRIQLLEYNLTAAPWHLGGDEGGDSAVVALGVPIASDRLFYGYLVLLYPQSTTNGAELDEGPLVTELKRLARDVYRPVLAILHQGRHEKDLEDVIENEQVAAAQRSIRLDEMLQQYGSNASAASPCPYPASCVGSKEVLEDAFAKLWQRRAALKDGNTWEQQGLNRLKETLLFGGKFYASPKMRDIIRTIAANAPSLVHPTKGKPLPTVLIYGDPGSGKESVSEMIPLFTDLERGYFAKDRIVVNVAALKPDAIVGPAIMGLDISYGTRDLPRLMVAGAFLRSTPEDDDESPSTSPRVFVLDELNSLPVEYHGILLRVLEQGEVLPLFGTEPQYVQHLIIGIVNEDPTEVIRETEKEMLRDAGELLGRLARNLLQDAILSGRKLRPDIFYRMARTLYIRVPSLAERSDDIPILFFFFVRRHLKEYRPYGRNAQGNPVAPDAGKGSSAPSEGSGSVNERQYPDRFDMIFEFPAYDLLMEEGHPWRGNLRELQNLAAKTALLVWRDAEGQGRSVDSGSTVYHITREHVRRAFKSMEEQGQGEEREDSSSRSVR